MPLFSIIIPIYNVEKYLSKCIDSVINQEYKNIEIILVDDGSPDNCPKICDKYAEKDSRIKVIHKENGGLSDARNYGIKAAKGEYLLFLDSDDYWEGDCCLKNIVKKIDKNPEIDVLVYGCMDYSCISGKKEISRTGYNNEIITAQSKYEVLKYFFESGLFPGSAWITVTRRKFIVDNKLFFIKGIKSEDIDWLLNVFLHANKFDSVDDYFYIYLKYRSDSITGTINKKSVEDLLYIIEKWSKIIENKQYEYISPFVNDYLSYHLLCTVILYNRLSKSDKKEIKERIKRNDNILRNLKTKKVKYASIIYKILGIDLSSKVLNFYHNSNK